MLTPRLYTAGAIVSSLAIALALSRVSSSLCDEPKKTSPPPKDEFLAVYLTDASIEQANAFLAKKGITDREARMVCFRSGSVRPDYSYIYSPLYGQRAAFRLKGNPSHTHRTVTAQSLRDHCVIAAQLLRNCCAIALQSLRNTTAQSMRNRCAIDG
jgi:hypothetical protein